MRRSPATLINWKGLVLYGVVPVPFGLGYLYAAATNPAPGDYTYHVLGSVMLLTWGAFIPSALIRVTASHLSYGRFPYRWHRIPCDQVEAIGTTRRNSRDELAVYRKGGTIVRLPMWSYRVQHGGGQRQQCARDRDRLDAITAAVGCGCLGPDHRSDSY